MSGTEQWKFEGFGSDLQSQYGQHAAGIPRRGPKTPSVTKVRQSGGSPHIKQHQCDICFKVYSGASGLHYHMATVHTGKYKYQCETCLKRFVWNQDYKTHIRTHQKVSKWD